MELAQELLPQCGIFALSWNVHSRKHHTLRFKAEKRLFDPRTIEGCQKGSQGLLTFKSEEEKQWWLMRWKINGSVLAATGWMEHSSGVRTAASTNLPIAIPAGDRKKDLLRFRPETAAFSATSAQKTWRQRFHTCFTFQSLHQNHLSKKRLVIFYLSRSKGGPYGHARS